MRSRFLFLAMLLAFAVLPLDAQSVFRGQGSSESEAMAALCGEVAEAYASGITRDMVSTYSDEFRVACVRSVQGPLLVREIRRSDVEAIFRKRKDKAEAVRAEAVAADKSGDPGRAAMYYHWAAALYMSLPGSHDAEVAQLLGRRNELRGYQFPRTGASNVGALAEKIYALASDKGRRTSQRQAPVTSPTAETMTVSVERKSAAEPAVPSLKREALADISGLSMVTAPVYAGKSDSLAPVYCPAVEAVSPRAERHLLVMLGAGVLPDVTAQTRVAWMFSPCIGAYVSAGTNFHWPACEYSILQDGTILADDGAAGRFWGNGHNESGQWNACAGIIWNAFLSGRLGLYAGAGYACRRIVAYDIDGIPALVSDLSTPAPCADFGLLYTHRRMVLSVGGIASPKWVGLNLSVGVKL